MNCEVRKEALLRVSLLYSTGYSGNYYAENISRFSRYFKTAPFDDDLSCQSLLIINLPVRLKLGFGPLKQSSYLPFEILRFSLIRQTHAAETRPVLIPHFLLMYEARKMTE